MAWIDHPAQVYSMFKSDRPLVNIPPTHNTHQDPLRTPEDTPLRAPWISTHIDGVYHLTPLDLEHNRFPDIEDHNWDMGMVSPPSPSRRNSLDLLSDIDTTVSSHYDLESEDSDWELGMTAPRSPSRRSSLDLPPDAFSNAVLNMDGLPTLSPPSPSMRSIASLPDEESGWPPADFECPQLSPPSPVHCGNMLSLLEFETHSLFIEDVCPPFVAQTQCLQTDSLLQTEFHALSSLRDRTMYAERTSRARNKALRGRERELGRAVATLRAGSDPAPDPTSMLHAYRTAATRVMFERTEEKRRRKKDKERLKELRVILCTGVDVLLGTEGRLSLGVAVGVGGGPDAAVDEACGLGLALHGPPSEEDRERALAERTHMMRRLTACMTMRRRDLGMRSLVEAGMMNEETERIPVRAARRPSRLAHTVFSAVSGDPGGALCADEEGGACVEEHW